MWTVKTNVITPNQIIQFSIWQNGVALTFEEVIDYWRHQSHFRTFYNTILRDHPFDSYFWEHPPITRATLQQPYEFVLVNSRSLPYVEAEVQAFRQYFDSSKPVVTFLNLGKDATLIVPTPQSAQQHYAHLSRFVRHAPVAQINDFWRTLGITYQNTIGNTKKWLSTAGLGVSWLHVRIDSRPKYYRYRGYKHG